MYSIDDLHCHLNGSFSHAFLNKVAERNHCPELFRCFEQVHNTYLEKIKDQPADGFSQAVIKLIWQQFALIHQIVQTLDDIREGVLDVAQSSDANYIEIRTTPKQMGSASFLDYIDAFSLGLNEANALSSQTNTRVKGLLSLDRTQADFDTVKQCIDWILKHPESDIQGIDISGNPALETRSLVGDDLKNTIQLVLDSNLKIAIHMGEVDAEHERRDIDTILSTIKVWCTEHPEKKLGNRVRLGHCIYLSHEQIQKIRQCQLPVEVCPSCHQQLNWHLKNQAHPVTNIYPSLPAPVVCGTDDQSIFSGSALSELQQTFMFFANSSDMTLKDFANSHQKYRFS